MTWNKVFFQEMLISGKVKSKSGYDMPLLCEKQGNVTKRVSVSEGHWEDKPGNAEVGHPQRWVGGRRRSSGGSDISLSLSS